MERKRYNPLESAELMLEQNANMIDGVLNNLPPVEDRPTDRVKNYPSPDRELDRCLLYTSDAADD